MFKTSIFTLLLAAILLLAACTTSPPPPEVTSEPEATPTTEPSGRGVGDTLHILNPAAPAIFNPHLTYSVKDHETSRIIYEPLATLDAEGNLIPFLAAEIPSLENGGLAEDYKSVTWKLKQDVKWSDGTPFTAEDVKFTYDFIVNPDVSSTSAGLYGAIESVDVLDSYTVKVTFKNANLAWAVPFVGVRGLILPRHMFEEYNNSNAREAPANTLPVGTGPYRVKEPGIKPQEVLLLGTQLVSTNKIVFEPNPYFREADKPYFSRVELRGGGIPSEAARLVLQEGQVDYAYNLEQLSPEVLAEMDTGEQGRIVPNFSSAVYRILINHTDPNRGTADGELSSREFPHPFFQDKKVRQAFAHAIDREAMAALFGKAGLPTYNNLVAPPTYKYDTLPETFYEYNLDKAAALLDEAGWVDSDGDGIRDKGEDKLEVVFQTTVGDTLQQAQQIVKDSLESIGVEVDLKIVDPSIMFGSPSANPDHLRRFNSDLQMIWIISDSPDPTAYMRNWTCNQIPQKANDWRAGLNVERWCNQEYDALYEQTFVELDPETRRQIFVQMNDLLVEDVALIPTVYLATVQGVSHSIEGVTYTPWDATTWNIKDWRRSENE